MLPVIFLIENNHYAFSTPTSAQYRCRRLSDRAAGYAIEGATIDGTDPWQVYSTICDWLEAMDEDRMPRLLECDTLRLQGHAAYDKATYVDPAQLEAWQARDPLPKTRLLAAEIGGLGQSQIAAIEAEIDDEIEEAVKRAIAVGRPSPTNVPMTAYARGGPARVKAYRASRVKNGDAVNRALDYLLESDPRAVLLGLDIECGSAFKTRGPLSHGRARHMPLCESAGIGFAPGAQPGARWPIYEFQFADFGTACTQVNRTADMVLPFSTRHSCCDCPAAVTMGAFHRRA